MISSFEDLEVWQKAHRLTLTIYRLTKTFPNDEKFILVCQLRRAVLSIQTNIAEGSGRRTTKDFIGFIYNAIGSLQEVRSLVLLSYDLGYFEKNNFNTLRQELISILMMLNKLIHSLSDRMPIL